MQRRVENVVFILAILIAVALAAGGTDWAAWVTAVATTALAGGVLFAKNAVDDAKKTRHAQLVIEIDKLWNDPAMIEASKVYVRYSDEEVTRLVSLMYDPAARSPTDDETADYESLSTVADLVELTGAIWADGGLTLDVIYNVWGGQIAEVWTAWENALPRMRDHLGEPDLFEHFESLGKAMLARLPEPKAKSGGPGASGRPDQPGGAAAELGKSEADSSVPPSSVPNGSAGRTSGLAVVAAAAFGVFSAVLLRSRNASK